MFVAFIFGAILGFVFAVICEAVSQRQSVKAGFIKIDDEYYALDRLDKKWCEKVDHYVIRKEK